MLESLPQETLEEIERCYREEMELPLIQRIHSNEQLVRYGPDSGYVQWDH